MRMGPGNYGIQAFGIITMYLVCPLPLTYVRCTLYNVDQWMEQHGVCIKAISNTIYAGVTRSRVLAIYPGTRDISRHSLCIQTFAI